jgi:hypothetical protein
MSALAALQRGFMDALFDAGDTADAGMRVYRRTVAANLHDALAATYPVVRRLVGDAFFREAARCHSREHPSRSGDLHAYGEHFARFLADYSHAQALPYLADVARLEWACHECFLAAEGESLDFAALRRVDSERQGDIRFALHPAVRLVRSAHPIAVIWQANQPGGDGSAGGDGPDHVLVARAAGEVRVAGLEAREWDFLAALARGATFEEASSGYDEAAGLDAVLQRHVQDGVIAGFALTP